MDVSQNPQSNRVANETPWQQWRRQGCCTERLWNQRMQIFYVEYDDQAEARATISSRPDNSHWISFCFTLQEEQSLCFLTAWQSIHLGQPRITFPSPFRVAGVGRSMITRFLNFKSIRLNTFGGWKFDRGTTKLHARILRGKGVQKKEPNMFTVCRKLNKRNFSPTSASRHRCSIAQKSMDVSQNPQIEQSCKWDAMATMKKARVLHRKALKPEDADTLCGVWWPSWSTCNNQQPTWQFPLNKLLLYPASRHRCSIAQKSMDVSQNPQSNRVANETPWQPWRRQGCCTERLWNQRMQIFYVEYDDQAEARATISSRPDNSHWISFFLPCVTAQV